MTDEELDDYIDTCMAALEAKQGDLARQFGLGTHPRWGFDHDTGILWFGSSEDQIACSFQAHGIGTYSPTSETFQWSWASSVLPEHAKSSSEPFKSLSDTTGLNIFAMPAFSASEEMAWQVSAMCVAHAGGLGCYRAPSAKLSSFLLIESVLSGVAPNNSFKPKPLRGSA